MSGFPKQSGLISVWFATLVYALGIAGIRPALMASTLVLLSAEPVQRAIARRDLKGLAWTIPPLTLYLALVPPEGIVILALPFLAMMLAMFPATRGGREVTHWSTVIGSSLIAMHSPAYLLSHPPATDEIRAFLPVIYTATATSQASLRVLGENRWVSILFKAMLVFQVVLGFILGLGLVLLIDALSRVFQPKLSVKAHGILEFLRMTTVCSVMALHP